MRKNTYSLPKFIGVILKKVFAKGCNSNQGDNLLKITKEQFLNYCLAVYLLAWLKYNEQFPEIVNGSRDLVKDNENNCESLSSVNGYSKNSWGTTTNLIGLVNSDLPEGIADSNSYVVSKDSVSELEMLINEFFRYQCLRKGYKKSGDAFDEYQSVTSRLEPLRQKFALPARFEYNKFIRRDNSESINGIVVEINLRADDQVEMVEATSTDAEPDVDQDIVVE